MTVEVSVNGRLLSIALEPLPGAPGSVTATVDGRRRVMDLSWIDADTLSVIEGGTALEIRLQRRGDSAVGVEIGGTLYEVVVTPRRRETASGSADMAPGVISPFAVTAPMPGRIVRFLVGVGDRVAARQGVVVVEAMKMENELRAPRAGTVKEIAVAAGATVDPGSVLVVLE